MAWTTHKRKTGLHDYHAVVLIEHVTCAPIADLADAVRLVPREMNTETPVRIRASTPAPFHE